LTALESVAARDVPGGTAPVRVAAAHAVALETLANDRQWLREREARYTGVMQRGGSTERNGGGQQGG
jgi:hypothetical protein